MCSSFTATLSTITAGQSSILAWKITNANISVILKRQSGTSSQPASGSVTVKPAKTYTYAITAKGSGGAVTCSRLVTVTTPYSQGSYSTGGYSQSSYYSQASYSTYKQASYYSQGAYSGTQKVSAPTTLTATAVTGELVRYLKTGETTVSTNITKALALSRCQKSEALNPGTVLKCTWNGVVIYTPSTSGSVLGASTISELSGIEEAIRAIEAMLNARK